MADSAELRLGRPIICVDFDGVLNTYDRWVSPEYLHPMRPGAAQFLRELNESGYAVVVFTTRWHEWVRRWLEENKVTQYVEDVTDRKPPAAVFLDDRAVCFRGDFCTALDEIRTFRPFWDTPETR